MAYLNVRERRIETKIAYVGPHLAGKGTNLKHLRSDVARGRATEVRETTVDGSGALASLEWVPLNMPRFNDCEVAVKVVAARGALSTERLEGLLDDVDGVVVVADAAPDAQEENRRTLQLVREALAKDAETARAVVVQWNKSDLENALPVSALETSEWPVVTASASRGEGVVETLETALANVLEAMKAKGNALGEAKADPNPLLTALRQILCDTVTQHMAGLERETLARVTEAVTEQFGPRLDGIDRIGARLEQTDRALAALAESLHAMQHSQTETAKQFTRALSSQERLIAALAAAIERSQSELATVSEVVRQAAERTAEVHATSLELCSRRDVIAAEGRLREELTARAKADREHLTSIASVLRRGIEGTAADLKKLDVRETLGQVTERLDRLQHEAEGLKATVLPAATAAAGLPSRMTALEGSLQREMREQLAPRLARIDDSVQVLQVDAGESFARAEASIGAIQTGLAELLDELKRRKKGWFS